MRISRRGLLRSSAVTAGVSALPSLAQAAVAATASRTATLGTTVGQVIVRGPKSAGGYRALVRRAGEPHLVRTDLGVKAAAGRARRRRGLLAFAQLSDLHVVDHQSPMRVEYVDRYEDQSEPGDPVPGLFGSAYRPNEMLTAHVAEAMVRAINEVGRGPVSGRPLAFVIQTGDNSDNSQRNEIRWNIDLLDGGTVRPDSGDLTRYEGVMDGDPTYYDTHYWHPDGTPDGLADDRPRAELGFPTVPGLLDAARRPFRARGLDVPWYTAFGNHDGLSQGNFPETTQFGTVATGPLKLVSPPAGMSQQDLLDALRGDYAGFLAGLATSPYVREVTPDPERRILDRAALVEEHFTTTGTPEGHGFTSANRRDGTAYYTFDRGPVRFIVLDTVNPNGEANGSLDQTQFGWLGRKLAASDDRVVVICSHHTSGSMDNPLVGTGGDTEPRVLGDEVLALLLSHRNVVAWVNGHTHSNNVWARPRTGGGGLWEINTASHIDWPQQSRLLEILDNRDGTLSIFATMLDHRSPVEYGGRLDDVTHLAALGRELAANDWQERESTRRGRRADRNVELLVPAPRFLRQ
ncbi:MAG TPA: TIGR03767 family metallophosphoesterase [Nocardioides sp.]|nr:TIGR03767 family metallophosphoesterase [Nocardioides sp.]